MTNINEVPPTTPPPPAREVPERKNGFALASLILGIVGFLINPLLIVSILAIIFGIVGLVKAPVLGRRNLAIIGIVLAVVGGIISIVVTSAILGSIGQTAQSISRDTSVAASEPVEAPSEDVASEEPEPAAEPESDVPDGYEALTDDIYFKWGKLDTSNQFLAKKAASVIAPNGCGTLYISAVLLDAEGTNIGSAFATANGIEAGGKANIEFLITEDADKVDQIKTNEATCY